MDRGKGVDDNAIDYNAGNKAATNKPANGDRSPVQPNSFPHTLSTTKDANHGDLSHGEASAGSVGATQQLGKEDIPATGAQDKYDDSEKATLGDLIEHAPRIDATVEEVKAFVNRACEHHGHTLAHLVPGRRMPIGVYMTGRLIHQWGMVKV